MFRQGRAEVEVFGRSTFLFLVRYLQGPHFRSECMHACSLAKGVLGFEGLSGIGGGGLEMGRHVKRRLGAEDAGLGCEG